MSSLTSSKDRFRVFGAMALAGFVALCVGTRQASSQLIASANGNQAFLSAPVTLTGGAESTSINVASVTGSSGLYDVNGVVTLTNASATVAQSITAQYFVGTTAVSPAVTTSLAGGATSTTLALPQQVPLATSAAVSLHITNNTGTANVTVGTGSGVTVTGYTNNFPSTATAPGSNDLGTTTNAGATGPVANFTVTVPAVSSAQGLYSLNSALFVNNNAPGLSQQVTARYTVDGTATGSSFQVSLPASSSTMLALPSQLTGLGTGTHTIGIQLTTAAGNASITVGAGSSISATAYNATSPNNSATAVQVANAGIGGQTGTFSSSFVPQGGAPTPSFFVTVPTNATTATFYDANAVLMFSDSATQGVPVTIQAQYLINGTAALGGADGTAVGPIFTTILPPGTNGIATLYMPEQFASLTAGRTVAVQLTALNSAIDWNIDADSLTLIAHNMVPNAATPEPASMSLAAMAMMAFGAAAYRKRKAARVQA